jgi:hypothetical protein
MALLPIATAALLLLAVLLVVAGAVVVVARAMRGGRRFTGGPVATRWSPGRHFARPERTARDAWRRRDAAATVGVASGVSWTRDRAVAWRWAGIVAGAGVAYVAATGGGRLGSGLLVAAPLFGLCALAGALAGEFTRPGPGGPVRRAQLRVRRVRDYAPGRLGAVVIAATVALVGLAAVTTTVASGDDLGRAGRWLACVNGPYGAAHGPWPGSFYTVPGLGLVLAGLVLAALTLRRIARRPQPADDADADDDLRRRSTDVVVSATGILVLVPLAGIAVTAGVSLMALADQCGHAWWTGAGWSLIVLTGAASVLAVWCVSRLLLPSNRGGAAR